MISKVASKALICAVILDKILRSTVSDAFNKVGLSKKYFEELKNMLGSAWWVAYHYYYCAVNGIYAYRNGTKTVGLRLLDYHSCERRDLEIRGVQHKILGLALGAQR